MASCCTASVAATFAGAARCRTTHRKAAGKASLSTPRRTRGPVNSGSCAGARGGRVGGNVLDFIASMESCSIREAALRLQTWFSLADEPAHRHTDADVQRREVRSVRTVPPKSDSVIGPEHNPPLTFTLT